MKGLLRIAAAGFSLLLFAALAYAPTAQEEAPAVLEIPVYEGGEVQWELYLSDQDFLGWLKEALELEELPPEVLYPYLPQRLREEKLPIRIWERPLFYWLLGEEIEKLLPLERLAGRLAELVMEALAGLEGLRALGYGIEGVDAAAILEFYEQRFTPAQGWQRNFWVPQGAVVYSLSEGGSLREVAAFFVDDGIGLEVVGVRTRGFLRLRPLVELLILGSQLQRLEFK